MNEGAGAERSQFGASGGGCEFPLRAPNAVIGELAKSVEGAVEGGLGAAVVTEEGTVAGFIAGIDEADADAFVVASRGRVVEAVASLERPELGLEDAVFEAAGSFHAPMAGGDMIDEHEFLGVGGLPRVDEFGADALELERVLVRQDGVCGGESVAHGVPAGALLAFDGAGTGGFLGVAAVGGDLFFGGHG